MARMSAPIGKQNVTRYDINSGYISARLDIQVEHVRLGIPMSTPLAVQQWDGLIAVNYEARKFGVKRGDRADAARQKCPEIMLVHVETISANPADAAGDEAGKVDARPDKGASKVSLERWGLGKVCLVRDSILVRLGTFC